MLVYAQTLSRVECTVCRPSGVEDEGKMKSFMVTTAHNARVDLGELSTYLQYACTGHHVAFQSMYCRNR